MNVVKNFDQKKIPIVLIFVTISIFGVVSFLYLDFNIIPEIEFPELIVVTVYPNATPSEISNLITRQIEEAAVSLKHVKEVKSVSKDSVSIVKVQYDWKANLTSSHIELRDRIDQLTPFFPKEVKRPVILHYQPAMDAVAGIVIKGKMDSRALYLLCQKDVKSYLEKIDGLAKVAVQGGDRPQVTITIKAEMLDKYNLSIDEIKAKITETNKDFPVGFFEEENTQYQIRVKGRFENYEEFGSIVIKKDKQNIVKLSDLGSIDTESIVYDREEKRNGVLVDGEDVLVILVYKQTGYNIIKLSKNIREAVNLLQQRYKDTLEISTLFDESENIKKSLNDLLLAIVIGIIITVLSIYIFIYDIKISMLITVTIPFSIIASFIFMRFSNYSINLLTLGGFSIAIGMIVDNAVIVVENVINHLHASRNKENYISSIKEIVPAVVSSTFTTIVVFFPMFFLSGILKIIFIQMVMIITFSLIFSMIYAIYLLPILLDKIILKDSSKTKRNSFNTKIENIFRQFLSFAFRNKKSIYTVLFIITIIGIISVFIIPKAFIESSPQSTFFMKIFIKNQVPYKYTERFMEQIEKIVRTDKRVKTSLFLIGVDKDDLTYNLDGIYGENTAIVKVDCKVSGELMYKVIESIRKKTSIFNDVDIIFTIPDNPIQKLISKSEFNTVIRLYDTDNEQLIKNAITTAEKMKKINGITDIFNSYYLYLKENEVILNRDALALYSANSMSIAEYLMAFLNGHRVGFWKKDEYDIPVVLKLQTQQDIRKAFSYFTIKNDEQKRVPLMYLISIREKTSPNQIYKINQKQYAWIECNTIKHASLFSLFKNPINEVKTLLDENKSSYEIIDQFSILKNNLSELLLAVILAIFFEYAILASQFKSFTKPIIVMFLIPFTIAGTIAIMLFLGNSFNINTFMSIIVLVGLLVNIGIMLFFDYDLKKANTRQMLIDITAQRLPPILSTQLSTIVALIPSMFTGNKIQSSLALTIIIGLIYSTLLTLLFIPIWYEVFYFKKEPVK